MEELVPLKSIDLSILSYVRCTMQWVDSRKRTVQRGELSVSVGGPLRSIVCSAVNRLSRGVGDFKGRASDD